jgi:hypothetical protein
VLNNNTIGVIGARGGQGTSTIATVLALYASYQGPTGLIGPDPADLLAGLGRSDSGHEPVPMSDTLTIASRPLAGPAVNIVDCGTLRHPASTLPAELVAVVRGPCYLALKTLVASRASQFEGLIIVHEAHRSISPADAVVVTGLPVLASVRVTDRVARIVDAGLLGPRATALPEFAALRALAGRLHSPAGSRWRSTVDPVASAG